jgi:predicted ester cyclase
MAEAKPKDKSKAKPSSKASDKAKATRKRSAKTVVSEYMQALADQDLEHAVSLWKPGTIDTIYGFGDLEAPHGIRAWFSNLFGAFPDWQFEVLEVVASGEMAVARWRAKATFTGPGKFQGLQPNGARIELEGADVFRVVDDQLVENNAYTNGAVLAQQVGLLPPTGSSVERAMTGAFNAKTAATGALRKLRDR